MATAVEEKTNALAATRAKGAASVLATSTVSTPASTAAALGDYEPADTDAEHGRS